MYPSIEEDEVQAAITAIGAQVGVEDDGVGDAEMEPVAILESASTTQRIDLMPLPLSMKKTAHGFNKPSILFVAGGVWASIALIGMVGGLRSLLDISASRSVRACKRQRQCEDQFRSDNKLPKKMAGASVGRDYLSTNESACWFFDQHPICTYSQICFSTVTSQWTVPYHPPKANPHWNQFPGSEWQTFHVRQATAGVNGSGLSVGGSTYLVMCTVQHFGHILINMLVPSFHALSSIGRDPYLDSTKFLVNCMGAGCNHTGRPSHPNHVFEFFSGHPDQVLSLNALIAESTRLGHTRVCFDELVVGFLADALVVRWHPPGELQPHVFSGMIEPLRRQVSRTRGVSNNELVFSMRQKCKAIFLTRGKGQGRHVVNFNHTIELMRQSFGKDTWAVEDVSFDGRSLAEQYRVIWQTSLFVSVSGTGSHWAMFLREGTVSIVIESRGFNANADLCAILPSVYCLSVNSTSQSPGERSDLSVDVEDMKCALQAAGQRLEQSQCRST